MLLISFLAYLFVFSDAVLVNFLILFGPLVFIGTDPQCFDGGCDRDWSS